MEGQSLSSSVIPGRAQRDPGISKRSAQKLEIPGSMLRIAPE
jgi:hypothetical protein